MGYLDYPDDGCAAARAIGYDGPCLECPLPECLMDDDLKGKSIKNLGRDEEIRHRWKSGKSPVQLAREFGLSRRQVERIVRTKG